MPCTKKTWKNAMSRAKANNPHMSLKRRKKVAAGYVAGKKKKY